VSPQAGFLEPDLAQLERFVRGTLRHADEGTFVSLRSFTHEAGTKPFEIKAVRINGDLGAVARVAGHMAAAPPTTGRASSSPRRSAPSPTPTTPPRPTSPTARAVRRVRHPPRRGAPQAGGAARPRDLRRRQRRHLDRSRHGRGPGQGAPALGAERADALARGPRPAQAGAQARRAAHRRRPDRLPAGPPPALARLLAPQGAARALPHRRGERGRRARPGRRDRQPGGRGEGSGLSLDKVKAAAGAEDRDTAELVRLVTTGTEYLGPLVALSARYAGAACRPSRSS
jgi:hypothetical protein